MNPSSGGGSRVGPSVDASAVDASAPASAQHSMNTDGGRSSCTSTDNAREILQRAARYDRTVLRGRPSPSFLGALMAKCPSCRR
jgi:hypothetical protein